MPDKKPTDQAPEAVGPGDPQKIEVDPKELGQYIQSQIREHVGQAVGPAVKQALGEYIAEAKAQAAASHQPGPAPATDPQQPAAANGASQAENVSPYAAMFFSALNQALPALLQKLVGGTPTPADPSAANAVVAKNMEVMAGYAGQFGGMVQTFMGPLADLWTQAEASALQKLRTYHQTGGRSFWDEPPSAPAAAAPVPAQPGPAPALAFAQEPDSERAIKDAAARLAGAMRLTPRA